MKYSLLFLITLILTSCSYIQPVVDFDLAARRAEVVAIKKSLCSLPWWAIQEDPTIPPVIKSLCSGNAQTSSIDLLDSLNKPTK
jgi:hypothetical protein